MFLFVSLVTYYTKVEYMGVYKIWTFVSVILRF